MNMEPELWAFYDDQTTMEELLTSFFLDDLSPRGESESDARLTVRIQVPSGGDTYTIESPQDLTDPIKNADTVRIGGGGGAKFDDITVRPEYNGLTVDPLLSVGASDTIGVPLARVSLTDNQLVDNQGTEDTQSNTEQVVRFAETLFEESDPDFLFINPYGSLTPEQLPDHDDYGSFLLGDLHWLYIVSGDTAAHLGRERLLSAPVYESRALENGGILLRMYETMGNEDIGPEPRDRLREHLTGD